MEKDTNGNRKDMASAPESTFHKRVEDIFTEKRLRIMEGFYNDYIEEIEDGKSGRAPYMDRQGIIRFPRTKIPSVEDNILSEIFKFTPKSLAAIVYIMAKHIVTDETLSPYVSRQLKSILNQILAFFPKRVQNGASRPEHIEAIRLGLQKAMEECTDEKRRNEYATYLLSITDGLPHSPSSPPPENP